MSVVAEYAARLHKELAPSAPRVLAPVECRAREEKLYDIRAVIFDVYGTLIDYGREEFADAEAKARSLLAAFGAVVERFGLGPYLRLINPGLEPQRTLSDFYHGLIALDHEKSRREDIQTPEVRVERIWGLILMMLKRRGFEPSLLRLGTERDVAKCMAYYYNFVALGRGLYAGVVDALARLRRANVRLGILSNAQFYTPIDLTLFVRDQSGGRYEDSLELFDSDLVFFSYEYGIAKPGEFLFRKLYDVLYEYHILPSQTVFVGNDLVMDIKPAQDVGMKAAFFCGDRRSAFMHDAAGVVVPDIAFSSFDRLPELVSFHDKGKVP